MKYIFMYVLRVISRRKRHFCFTALVVALGISLVVQTQILNDTITRNYEEIITEFYGNIDIEVFPIGLIYFTQNVSDTLIQELSSDFEGIYPKIMYSTTAYYQEKGQFEEYVRIETIGLDFDRNFWGNIKSNETGKEIDIASLQADEIVISPELADSLGTSIGAQITIFLLDERGTPISHNVSVKDIYDYTGYGRTGDPSDLRRIFMSEVGAQSVIASSFVRPITTISFGIKDHENEPFLGREQTNEAKRQIEAVLRKNYPDTKFIVHTIREDNRERIEQDVAGYASTFQMFGIVTIIAGLLLITNIQLMNIEEREQQIGMLRAIGAKKRDIFFSYSIETLLIGVTGGILGLVIGMGISIWLNGLSRSLLSAMGNLEVERSIFDIIVDPGTLLVSLFFAITLSFITGMVPALRARSISIIEIVRGTKSKISTLSFNGKKSMWPLIAGSIFMILGLIILISLIQQGKPFYAPEGYLNIEKESVDNLQGLACIALGIIFASFRLQRHQRLGITIGGLLMVCITIWGLQAATGWIEEGSDVESITMTGLLCAVTGATAIVGVNLEILTAGLRKTLSYFKRIRSTGLVATRYMNSRKPRAVLTFATFAVILSLNFFFGSYAASQISGSSQVWEDYMTEVPIVVGSQVPFNLSTLDYPSILQDHFNEIEKVYPLGVGTVLPFIGSISQVSIKKQLFYSKLISINFTAFTDSEGEILYPFIFEDLLPYYSQLSKTTRMEYRDKAREESTVFWNTFLSGQKINRETLQPVDSDDPDGLPMFISEGLTFLDPGDILSFTLMNGSLIEMIFAGRLFYFPSCNLHINEFTPGIIVSSEIASQLNLLRYGTKEFLIETTYGFDYNRNEDLCSRIEEFSNKAEIDSLLSYSGGTFYGITAHHLWDVFYYENSTNASALNFLQISISVGLVIGVIGLSFVSHRSVKERKREIGMLRSLGFSKKAISLAVLLELLFLGILGFIIGFFTGNYLAWVFIDLQTWELIIPWFQVSFYGVFILGSVFLAALIPCWLAARIPPSEALRYRG